MVARKVRWTADAFAEPGIAGAASHPISARTLSRAQRRVKRVLPGLSSARGPRARLLTLSLCQSDNALMARLTTSDMALRALLMLSQRRAGLRTADVARALRSSYTGAEKALAILLEDGVAARRDRRFVVDDSPRAQAAIAFALAFLSPSDSLAAIGSGNPSVEFCGTDATGALIVIRRFAETTDEAALRGSVEALESTRTDLRVELVHKDDLRETLLTDLSPRTRASKMAVLVGSVDVSFPDRTRHGDFDAPPLGHLNRAIATPSQRRIKAFARAHHLRRILAFGSATRADFRPDSDLDLLVETADGRAVGLRETVELIAEAERLFGRDVDLVTAPVRTRAFAERIAKDGVVLYESS